MIKVNLLATSQGAAPAREWLPREQRSSLLGLGLLACTALAVGGFWFYQRSEVQSVNTRIAAAETELVRLEEAARMVDDINARKAELSERLMLIERLRAEKDGPVHLIETISRSLPEGLWLVEIAQDGLSVEVDGRAMSLTAVTDFAERLQTSGLFEHPVEILTTTTETFEETTVVRFALRAETVAPVLDLPATLPAAAASAAAVPAAPGV